jgi:hypothetical protein
MGTVEVFSFSLSPPLGILTSSCKGSGLAHWPTGPDLDSATVRIMVRPEKNQVQYEPYPFDPRVYPHLASPLYLQRTDSAGGSEQMGSHRHHDSRLFRPLPAILQAIPLTLREPSPAGELVGRRNAAGSSPAAGTLWAARRPPSAPDSHAWRPQCPISPSSSPHMLSPSSSPPQSPLKSTLISGSLPSESMASSDHLLPSISCANCSPPPPIAQRSKQQQLH